MVMSVMSVEFQNLNMIHKKKILVAPSILSADFGKLNQEIADVEPYCDLIHVDIMDGHFVPNLSLGVPVLESIRCGKPLDVHLMIENPEKYLDVFAKAVKKSVGADLYKKSYLVFHIETVRDPLKTVRAVHELGLLAGIALNPDTELNKVSAEVLREVDMVLLMTVYPGFGGQQFIAAVMPKIERLRETCPELHIEVDGGINQQTARFAVQAGANILVAGSYVFGAKDRKAALITLKEF